MIGGCSRGFNKDDGDGDDDGDVRRLHRCIANLAFTIHVFTVLYLHKSSLPWDMWKTIALLANNMYEVWIVSSSARRGHGEG